MGPLRDFLELGIVQSCVNVCVGYLTWASQNVAVIPGLGITNLHLNCRINNPHLCSAERALFLAGPKACIHLSCVFHFIAAHLSTHRGACCSFLDSLLECISPQTRWKHGSPVVDVQLHLECNRWQQTGGWSETRGPKRSAESTVFKSWQVTLLTSLKWNAGCFCSLCLKLHCNS